MPSTASWSQGNQIVNIYKYLSRLGGPYGIIRQTEFFIYSKKDREALEKCMELGLKFPEITTWIRATKEDFRLVRDLGIRETGILVSCSDYHIFKKMKMTRKQAMDYYLATVADAFEAGVVPRCHLEDITRADFYGFVVPFVNELQKLSRQAGIPVKIRACDTMGYGIPYTEAALPRSVAGIIYGLQQYSDVPSECLEWHGHNDFYKAVVNASTAWLYGACAVNCSLLGIGERTGNIPLEAMVFEYASLRGSLDGMDPTVITEIADYFQHEIGYDIPPMTPFVGRDFNAKCSVSGNLEDAPAYVQRVYPELRGIQDAKYPSQSTRGGATCSAAGAIAQGLSDNGGLFAPLSFPQISLDVIERMGHMDYAQRAAAVLTPLLSGYDAAWLART